MDRVGRRAAVWVFGTASVVYLLDRATKLWAEHALPGHPIDVIPGALTLRFTTNSGGAFSVGEGSPWLFVGASIAVIVALLFMGFRRRDRLYRVAVGLVLAGALGNLTDRALRGPGFRGRVIDFVDLHVWPVFNLADSAIVVGALLIAWDSLRSRDRAAPAAAATGSSAEGGRADDA